jgi:hypothetical protein
MSNILCAIHDLIIWLLSTDISNVYADVDTIFDIPVDTTIICVQVGAEICRRR